MFKPFYLTGFQIAFVVDSGLTKKKMFTCSKNELGLPDVTGDDFQLGREAGFNDYVAKFDREALVNSLAETVSVATKNGPGNGSGAEAADAAVAEAAE